MKKVNDLRWKKGMTVKSLVDKLGKVGFQSTEMQNAVEVILKMKRSGAKVFFTFTSNMVTSGLRGFFAQLIGLKIIDVIVTTAGRPSGIAATAKAIATRNESSQPWSGIITTITKKTIAHNMRIMRPTFLPKSSRSICIGVISFSLS